MGFGTLINIRLGTMEETYDYETFTSYKTGSQNKYQMFFNLLRFQFDLILLSPKIESLSKSLNP